MLMYRVLLTVGLLISVVVFPVWLSVILALIGVVFFKNFYEIIVAAFAHDFLFGTAEHQIFGVFFFATILSLIVLIITEALKKYFIFYRSNNAFNS